MTIGYIQGQFLVSGNLMETNTAGKASRFTKYGSKFMRIHLIWQFCQWLALQVLSQDSGLMTTQKMPVCESLLVVAEA